MMNTVVVDQTDVTHILKRANDGSKEAYDALFPLIYDRLREIAQVRMEHEENRHTWCRTELVHEAYFQLINVDSGVTWQNRARFFAIASRCMRRILIDHARKKKAENQPGTLPENILKVEAEADELISLDKALNKLAQFDERLAQVVECRYFGEMSIEDTATALEISVSTVKREWAKARGWLYKELKQARINKYKAPSAELKSPATDTLPKL